MHILGSFNCNFSSVWEGTTEVSSHLSNVLPSGTVAAFFTAAYALIRYDLNIKMVSY